MLPGEITENGAGISDAALVLACYRRFGETFAKHLNGDYALALFDKPQGRLLLARDVVGVRPLYYWASERAVVAASEIKSILAHPEIPARPDDVVLADVLIGGDPNELRLTCFQNVQRVLPGHTVLITPERIWEFRHWDFDPTRQIRMKSPAEYAEALRALFEQAVRRRLRSSGTVGVMVSGGLDSSAILCQAEMLRQPGKQSANSIGISLVFPEGTPADEQNYLAEIEKMYGIEIRRLPFSSFRYVDDEHWLWQSEFPELRWDSSLACLRAASELGCTSMLDGDYGDHMMSSFAHLYDLATSLRWRRWRTAVDALAASMTDCSAAALRHDVRTACFRQVTPEWLLKARRRIRRLCTPKASPLWYTKRFRDIAYQRSLQQRRPSVPRASRQAMSCYRHFRYAHVLNGFEEVNKDAAYYGLEKAYPFMDRDLVQFATSIPAEILNWKGQFKGLFREAMRGILPESIRLRYWKADFTGLNSGAAAAGYSEFQAYFQKDSLAVEFGYVDPVTFQRAFARHQSKLTDQDIFPALQVNNLVALELWLRAFFRPGIKPKESYDGAVYQNGSTVPK
jgi:asparagine synthase (glutamine-hydrolysing)